MTHSDSSQPYFVTTAIPYVNSTPHVGFAMELIQADVLARYHRLVGRETRFVTGTDENSLKNARAAAEQGIATAALVRRNARAFEELVGVLNLSCDDFIRTSTDPRHPPGVEALWNACVAAGDIYRGHYAGLYCVGCEAFLRDGDLVAGVCPEHHVAPEPVQEDNYYFRLSRYADVIAERIESGSLRIVPKKRANEVLAFLRSGVEDISISRTKARALGWGIAVPGDPDQVVYVWFDALANYITALGYPNASPLYQRFWAQAEIAHVIGKGITRFHAVYWPAILLSAGLPLPAALNVHGYVTVDGAKIGKTLGNVVDPVVLVRRHGLDPLRYFLLRHVRTTEDGDFSESLLKRAHDAELANGLGNLLSRALALIERQTDALIPQPHVAEPADAALASAGVALPAIVGEAVLQFRLSDALAAIWKFIDEANRYVEDNEPWRLAKDPAVAAQQRLATVLYNVAEALRLVSAHLGPFLPTTAAAVAHQLGLPPQCEPSSLRWGGTKPGTPIRRGASLFPKQL